jgi:hypothetical protein
VPSYSLVYLSGRVDLTASAGLPQNFLGSNVNSQNAHAKLKHQACIRSTLQGEWDLKISIVRG